jgi:hypothetical protein
MLIPGASLGAAAFVLAPAPAFAQSPAKRVGIYAEGPGVAALRGDLDASLDASDEATHEKVRKGLAKRGLVGKLESHLAPAGRRKALDKALQGLARELNLDAVLVAIGRKKGDPVLIAIGPEGDVLLDTTTNGGDRQATSSTLERAGLRTPPPPPPEEKPSKPETPPEAKEKPSEAKEKPSAEGATTGQTHPLLVVALGGEGTQRRLRYSDPFTTNLRPYDVTGAPSVAASLELYPLARTHVPILRRFGLIGAFATSVALESGLPGGKTLPTTFQRWRVGLRGSAPLGKGTSAVGIEATRGSWSFRFDGDGDGATALPDVAYSVTRLGLDLRLDVGAVALLLGAGYGLVDGAGPMSDRFPRLKAGAVDGRLGLAIPLMPRLEARVWGEYTRYFLTMNPEPGDRFVAGGALDQFATVHLDAAYSL